MLEAGTPEIPWLEQGFFLPATTYKALPRAAVSSVPSTSPWRDAVSRDAHHKMAGYTAQFVLGWGGENEGLFFRDAF